MTQSNDLKTIMTLAHDASTSYSNQLKFNLDTDSYPSDDSTDDLDSCSIIISILTPIFANLDADPDELATDAMNHFRNCTPYPPLTAHKIDCIHQLLIDLPDSLPDIDHCKIL